MLRKCQVSKLLVGFLFLNMFSFSKPAEWQSVRTREKAFEHRWCIYRNANCLLPMHAFVDQLLGDCTVVESACHIDKLRSRRACVAADLQRKPSLHVILVPPFVICQGGRKTFISQNPHCQRICQMLRCSLRYLLALSSGLSSSSSDHLPLHYLPQAE